MGTLLRVATAGSVDDGKSTLLGRLLHDAEGIFADQLAAVADASARRGARRRRGRPVAAHRRAASRA